MSLFLENWWNILHELCCCLEIMKSSFYIPFPWIFLLSSNVCICVLYFRATATFELIFYLPHPLLAPLFIFVLTGPRPNLNLYCFILYWFQYCLNFVIYAARSEQYRWQSSMFWKCLTVRKSEQLLGLWHAVPCVQYKPFQERLYQIPQKAFALHI